MHDRHRERHTDRATRMKHKDEKAAEIIGALVGIIILWLVLNEIGEEVFSAIEWLVWLGFFIVKVWGDSYIASGWTSIQSWIELAIIIIVVWVVLKILTVEDYKNK